MNNQNLESGKLSLNVESLSFDSFERNSGYDIVCVAPIRTIVRREEEIIIIRRVRKVEEIDVSPACPMNTIPLGTNLLTVYANAGLETREQDAIADRKAFVLNLLNGRKVPFIPNDGDKPIKLKLEVEGMWNYGPAEFSGLVGAEGNKEMEGKEIVEGDMLFPRLRPGMLVAFEIDDRGEFTRVIYGKELTQEVITLKQGGKLYFVNNDQPMFYHDNDKYLTVKWRMVS